MKSIFKKALIITLALMLVLGTVCGCSSRGKKLMELDGEKMSVNMLMLLMSRIKGNLASSYSYGSQALKDSFWDTVIDASSGQTYDDYYTELVLDNAKTYLAALYLFDELDLKLPKSTLEEIDEELEGLIESDADGSKTYFNTVLAQYGANYDILRDAYIMEAKMAYLNDHLFGADGELISEENYEEYYQENYVRFRQIFFYTSKNVYETDKNGDVIYYSDLQNKVIAYDTDREGATSKKDENGNKIWVYTDTEGNERIAYDKKGTEDNPTQPNPLLDGEGNMRTEKLSEQELMDLYVIADETQAKVKNGEYKMFDTLVEQYTEDEGMLEYTNGYYVTANSDYDAPEVLKALFEMEDGEIRRVESDYGIHIIMKYELDEGGYADSQNEDFFIASDGSYNFMSLLKSDLLEAYLEKYKADIVIDDETRKTLSMKNVGANYHY